MLLHDSIVNLIIHIVSGDCFGDLSLNTTLEKSKLSLTSFFQTCAVDPHHTVDMAVSALMNLIILYALLSSTKAFWDPCGSPLGGICSAIEDIRSLIGSGCPQRETITWHYGICANEGGQCTAPYLGAFMWYGSVIGAVSMFPAYKVELKPNQVMGCNDNDFGCDPNVLSGARGTKYCWS